MTSELRSRRGSFRLWRQVRRQTSAWGLMAVVIVGSATFYPKVARRRAAQRAAARLAFVERSAGDASAVAAREEAATALSLRVRRLVPLLSSWETVGGCGAGGSGSGAAIKWVGRGVHGGLFNVIQTTGYLNLYTRPTSQDFAGGGYNLNSTTQISADLNEKWAAGVIIPYSYKVYNNYRPLPDVPIRRDITNGGLGDMSLMVIRKLGAINDTLATLTVGLPTGVANAQVPSEGSPLSQEKQLGFARPNATLSLDHVFDEIWGLFLVGGSGSYRGGRNKYDSYRAPSASAYSYVGFYAGPFVPSLGLAATGFSAHDEDINSPQNTPLLTITPIASVEWSSDYVALLLAGSVPYGTLPITGSKNILLPWTISLGIFVSPF